MVKQWQTNILEAFFKLDSMVFKIGYSRVNLAVENIIEINSLGKRNSSQQIWAVSMFAYLS